MAEWKELFAKVKDTDEFRDSIKLLKMMLLAKDYSIPGDCGNFHSPMYMIVHLPKVTDVKRLLKLVQPHWIGSECNLLVRGVTRVPKSDGPVEWFRMVHFPMLNLDIRVDSSDQSVTLMNRVLSYEDEEGKAITEKYKLMRDGREVFKEHKTYTVYPLMDTSE